MSAQKNNKNGFTIIEVIVVCVIVTIFVVGLFMAGVLAPIIARGNCWFTQDGIMRELVVNHTEARKILQTETHIIDPSVISVENVDGSRNTYLLDSDILFNYQLTQRVPADHK